MNYCWKADAIWFLSHCQSCEGWNILDRPQSQRSNVSNYRLIKSAEIGSLKNLHRKPKDFRFANTKWYWVFLNVNLEPSDEPFNILIKTIVWDIIY